MMRFSMVVAILVFMGACGSMDPGERLKERIQGESEQASSERETNTTTVDDFDLDDIYDGYGAIESDTCPLGISPYMHLPMDGLVWRVEKQSTDFLFTAEGFPAVEVQPAGRALASETVWDTECGEVRFRFSLTPSVVGAHGHFTATFLDDTCGEQVPCDVKGELFLLSRGD